MHCPRCDVEVLEERTRDGVTIDICPGCRGVWLDRGELERLISRASEPRDERDREERRGGRGRDEERRRSDRFEDRRGRDDEGFEGRRGRDDDSDEDDDEPRGRGGFFASLRNLFD